MLLPADRLLVRDGHAGRPSWANSNAAKKAFITNRIGDFGFLIAGFIMFWYLGSFQFDQVFEALPSGATARSHCRHHALHADRRGGQIGADPALCLAARRDGGPDPGLGTDPCRDDGDGGRLSRRPFRAALHARPAGAISLLR